MTLTDEVWKQLDPHAGRLSRRAATSVWLLVTACLALVAAGVVAARTGVIAPRFVIDSEQSTSTGGGPAASPSTPVSAVLTVYVFNMGRKAFTVTGIGHDDSDFRITGVTPMPFTVAPGNSVRLTIAMTITSCQLPAAVDPLQVHVSRFWGTQTISLNDNTGRPSSDWLQMAKEAACPS